MTPLEQAIRLCEETGYDFWEKVGEFSGKGYVHIDPTCVLLAEQWEGAWFVWLASGKNCLQRFIQLAPYPLPFVVWARELRGRSTPKYYRFDRVARLCNAQQRTYHGWQQSTKDPSPSASDTPAVNHGRGCSDGQS